MGLNELETEIGAWLQMLESMQLENTDMKTRLADAVRQTVSPPALEEAEQFQSRFINKDTVISFMRADIKKHMQQLRNYSEAGMDSEMQQDKLRSEMQKMETEFSNMRAIFSSYLLQLV